MELLTNVANLAIPGAGTVLSALKLTYDLCSGLDECGRVCKLVHGRFHELWDAIVDLDAKNELHQSSVLPRFSETLGTFIAFLQRHQRKKVLLRLASNRTIVDHIQRTNEEIDALFRLLQLEHMAEMSNWRSETDQCWERQQNEMQELLKNQRVITQLLSDGGLVEALALLKYESQHQREKNKPTQVQMMERTFFRVVRASKTQVPAIPPWFIPSDDVSYNPEDFGDGYFGLVHRGQWNRTEVVIKTLLVSDAKTQDSFLTEAGIWIQLNHPHVLKLYGACHVSLPPFFVCEDAEQGNFRQYFDRGLNRHIFWRLFREAMNGLVYLAKEKVVHGNLKCNNLLVGADGKAKISDFGFSFIRRESRALSKKEQVDSVRWKAPECVRGDVENPDLRSDVYSLGMCIIEAWTSDMPWGSDCSEAEIGELAFEFRMPEQPSGMSDRAWTLVKRMCHPHPKKRISLDEAVEEMAAIAEEESQGADLICPDPNCNAVVTLDAKFCSSCGYKITANGTQDFPPPPPSNNPFMVEFDAKLDALSTLCDEAQEYQLFCHHVRARLQDVYKQLNIRDRDQNLPDADIMLGCLGIADRFRLFLDDLRTKANIVTLVLNQRQVLASLEQLHFSIDSLVELLNIAEVETWRKQWEENRLNLEKDMKQRVYSVDNLLEHAQERESQTEVINKLRAEIEHGANQNNPDHLDLMLGMVDKIHRMSITMMAKGRFKLYVTLVKATDLAAADYWKGTSDPFVVLTLGSDSRKSSMIPRDLNPVWPSTAVFQFSVDTQTKPQDGGELLVEVWDHNTFTKHVLIGTTLLPVQMLVQQTPDPDSVIAYSLHVPSEFSGQKKQSKIHLKFELQRTS